MYRRLILTLLFLTVGTAFVATGQTATMVRVFNLENASVAEAFTAIEPMLSDEGSVTVQPRRGRITIQDSPEVVARITTRLNELDRVPGEYRIEVELLEGIDTELRSELPAELDRRLQRMFPFKSYRRAGRTVFQGEFGQATTATLGANYRVSFLADDSPIGESMPWGVADPGNRTQIKSLHLDRLTTGEGGKEKVSELLRTTVFLSPKQKMIIGAGSSEDSTSGLVLILTMHSVEDQ